MLKYAYQLGVEKALEEAGFTKESSMWLKLKKALGVPLKDFEKWQLSKGLGTATHVAREKGIQRLARRGLHPKAQPGIAFTGKRVPAFA